MTVVGTARTKVGLRPLQSEVTPSTLLIFTKESNVPLKYFGRLYLNVHVDEYYISFFKTVNLCFKFLVKE